MQTHTSETKPMSIRVPVTLRAALDAKAKATRRTVTSLVLEGIEKVAYEADPVPAPKLSFAEVVKKYVGSGRVGEGLDEKGMAERMRLIRGDD